MFYSWWLQIIPGWLILFLFLWIVMIKQIQQLLYLEIKHYTTTNNNKGTKSLLREVVLFFIYSFHWRRMLRRPSTDKKINLMMYLDEREMFDTYSRVGKRACTIIFTDPLLCFLWRKYSWQVKNCLINCWVKPERA